MMIITYLQLNPGRRLYVKNFDIIEAMNAIETPKHVQFLVDPVQGMASSGGRLVSVNADLDPVAFGSVEDKQIIEPLFTIVSAMHIDFVAVGRRAMVVAGNWHCAFDTDLRPKECLQVERVCVVESREAVPPAEDVQLLVYYVRRVRCPLRRLRTHRGDSLAEH